MPGVRCKRTTCLSLPHLIRDAPAREREQPALERAGGRIRIELRHLLRHGDDRLLNYFLRFGVAEAGLERDAVDELPVGIEEVLPALLIVAVLQPPDQAPARLQRRLGSRSFLF